MSALNTKILVTVFKDVGAKSKKEHSWSMLDLIEAIEKTEAPEKRQLPLLKLATFGTDRTDKGSLRHDLNVMTVSGCEGDYDAEQMRPNEAAKLLKKAGIASIVYTSASHTPEKPRWRVIAPFSDELLPEQRVKMVARINGILGGVLGGESFRLSQSFYFGDVTGKNRTEIYEIEGDFIDARADLDNGAILPEAVKRETEDNGERREGTALDEAQELFDRDYESGKLQEALQAALDYRWSMGDRISDDEDRDIWWRNICWAIHHGSGGDKQGFKIWSDYASKSYRASRLKKRGDSVSRAIATEWHYSKDDRPGGVLGFGTVYKRLEESGWVYGAVTVEDFEDDEDTEGVHSEQPPEKKADIEWRDTQDIPEHLLSVPGALGLAVEHYNATSTTFQPQFAVQTALALGSVTLARYWKSEAENFTSLYLVNLGATGSGKEFSRKFLTKCLDEAGLGGLMGPSKYASEAGIFSELAWKPRHVTVYDEFGRLLDSTRNNSNPNLRDAQTFLMSLFGILGESARPTAYSANGKTAQQIEAMRSMIVRRPAVTILGLSTPETFFDALSQDDVANGFLNRLLVVNSRQKARVEDPRAWRHIPKDLKTWIKEFGATDDEDFLAGETAVDADEPEVVEFTSGARTRLREIAQEVIDLQEDHRAYRLDGMFSRSREIAMRIALIVALSRNKKRIDEASLNWAWDYVLFYTMETVNNARRMMGMSNTRRIAEHLAEAIYDAGKSGLSVYEMGRKSHEFKKLEKRGHEEVLHALTTHHKIALAKAAAKPDDSDKKRGRPQTTRYVHTDFLK